MDRRSAFSMLGLEASAESTEINEALARKRADIKGKRDQAPTDALRTKFDELLTRLDEAEAALLGRGDDINEAARPSKSGAASLSQTKMADLPQAQRSHTGLAGEDAGAQLQLQPGQTLAGRYEIVEKVASGGMGAVYRAHDSNRGEDIAVKVMLPTLLRNERARERFLAEAKLSSQLSHPNIVNVYDVQHDGELYFLTMELLEGQDLRQMMDNRSLARQSFSEKDMLELADVLGEALAYAHQYTVHRDIKPENVWITEQGEYKLMDFGIARVQSTSQRTQTGAAMGTAYYMAPEQLKGRADIDGRADQYALGVMLYELATGDVPAGVIKPLREKRRDLSKGFATAVMQALQADPDDRFADMAAFTAALNKKGGGISMPALPGKGIVIAAAVVIALVLGGVSLIGASGAGGVGAMLADLLPMSEEERRKWQADTVRLQGQINTLARRLENARRTLDSDLRDAERNNTDELPRLKRWHEAVERNLFSGNLMSELEGERAVGEALLRDKEYEPSIESFRMALDGYETALVEFQAGEGLSWAEQEADRARQEYLALQQKTGYGEPEAARKARVLYKQSQSHEQTGELASAVHGWRDAEAAFRDAVDLMENTQLAAKSALGERTRWVKISQDYGVSGGDPEQSALNAMSVAKGAEVAGDLNEAIEQWRVAEQAWRETSDASSEQVAEVKEERRRAEADTAEAKRKQRLAAQKRAADRVQTPADAREFLALYPGSPYKKNVMNREFEVPVRKIDNSSYSPDSCGGVAQTLETRYQYDNYGRLVREIGEDKDVQHQYDKLHRKIRSVINERDSKEVVTFSYDKNDNLVHERSTEKNGDLNWEVKSKYGDNGEHLEDWSRNKPDDKWSISKIKVIYNQSGNIMKKSWESNSYTLVVEKRYDKNENLMWRREERITEHGSGVTTYQFQLRGDGQKKFADKTEGYWCIVKDEKNKATAKKYSKLTSTEYVYEPKTFGFN